MYWPISVALLEKYWARHGGSKKFKKEGVDESSFHNGESQENLY